MTQDPNYLPTIRDIIEPDTAPVHLDETDLAILDTLVTDARLSRRQIAADLGLSAPTVGERMARLERAGVLLGYTAVLNWSAIGYPQVVYLALDMVDRDLVPTMMKHLWDIPEVEEVSIVTGELDLLVRFRVRDYTHFRQILVDKVWTIPNMPNMTTMMTIAEMPVKNAAKSKIQLLAAERRLARAD